MTTSALRTLLLGSPPPETCERCGSDQIFQYVADHVLVRPPRGEPQLARTAINLPICQQCGFVQGYPTPKGGRLRVIQGGKP